MLPRFLKRFNVWHRPGDKPVGCFYRLRTLWFHGSYTWPSERSPPSLGEKRERNRPGQTRSAHRPRPPDAPDKYPKRRILAGRRNNCLDRAASCPADSLQSPGLSWPLAWSAMWTTSGRRISVFRCGSHIVCDSAGPRIGQPHRTRPAQRRQDNLTMLSEFSKELKGGSAYQ